MPVPPVTEFSDTSSAARSPSRASIVSSHLECEAQVPGISAEEFDAAAAKAKDTCPVSRLLKPGLESLTYAARLV